MRLLRPTSLIAAGALGVHELRYALAGGSLERAGDHGYLPLVALLAAVLLALACAHLVTRVLGARRSGDPEPLGPAFAEAWVIAAGALVAIFVVQESLEALLASGHAHGPHAAFGAGGWIAVPLAAGMGALIAVALTAARAAVAAAARTGERSPRPRPPMSRRPRLGVIRPRRTGVLAANLAGRAPPAAF